MLIKSSEQKLQKCCVYTAYEILKVCCMFHLKILTEIRTEFRKILEKKSLKSKNSSLPPKFIRQFSNDNFSSPSQNYSLPTCITELRGLTRVAQPHF